MSLSLILNAIGLTLITIGGIGAAICTPTVKYNSDGSVSLGATADKEARIRKGKRQRWVPRLLAAVGIGALLQLAALFVALWF